MKPEEQKRESARMRAASGEVDDSRPLVAFLYVLLRGGKLSPGDVETVLDEQMDLTAESYQFCNGWLAAYAQDITDRLHRPAPKITEAIRDCGGGAGGR